MFGLEAKDWAVGTLAAALAYSIHFATCQTMLLPNLLGAFS